MIFHTYIIIRLSFYSVGLNPSVTRAPFQRSFDDINFLEPWRGVLIERGFSPLRMLG